MTNEKRDYTIAVHRQDDVLGFLKGLKRKITCELLSDAENKALQIAKEIYPNHGNYQEFENLIDYSTTESEWKEGYRIIIWVF